jgi:hypothetical protein
MMAVNCFDASSLSWASASEKFVPGGFAAFINCSLTHSTFGIGLF